MEALFIYIAKLASLITLFYCAYYFLLRKETFFNSNRWFLLMGLITSVVLPFVVYTKVVLVNPESFSGLDLSNAVLNQTEENSLFQINWIYVVLSVYCLGLLILLIKFAMDYYSLNSILKGKKTHQQADFKFIDTNENIAPFSYFEYIVYNSSMYTETELENIIEHEKVHSDQNHTVDVLISRAFCILFWFNPIIWLYKKAITQNLEFIADKEAAKNLSDKKAYQYTLLKITTHKSCVAITNHFYQSLIKKRIIMLNKNQSKKRNLWKYCVVIPALVGFVVLFQVEVVAKEKQQVLKENSGNSKPLKVYKITKKTTDADLNLIKESLKKDHDIDFKISEVKRNSDNNLTSLKLNIKSGEHQSQSIQTGGDHPIKDFGVVVTTENDGSKKVGFQIADETNKNSKNTTEKKQKIKLKTNDNTNSDISTETSTNNNNDVATTIITGSDNKTTTKIITKQGNSQIIVSNSGKSNSNGKRLVIVDGVEMPADFDFDDFKSGDIKTINVLKGDMATDEYGDKGKNGVIVIETRK